MKTKKSGGLRVEWVPSESRFGPCSQRKHMAWFVANLHKIWGSGGFLNRFRDIVRIQRIDLSFDLGDILGKKV